jgi:hypothetical protein
MGVDMIAKYLPPDAAQPVHSAVTTPCELDPVYATAGSLAGGRGGTAANLESDDGSWLTIGKGELGVVLMWGDPLGETQHSLGSADATGTVVFDNFGSFTEVPAQFSVSIELTREAALQFLNTGSPLVEGLAMEPD